MRCWRSLGVDGHVLVSADTDFGEILSLPGAELPSFILFRQGNRTAAHRASILLANLDEVAADLDAGAIVVFTDDRIRLRRLPFR
jgi:predicted nuclease of predicted toxin-antitoxin system